MLFVVELQQFFCLDMNVYVMYVWPDSHHISTWHISCLSGLPGNFARKMFNNVYSSFRWRAVFEADRQSSEDKNARQGWNPMVVATMKGMFFSFRWWWFRMWIDMLFIWLVWNHYKYVGFAMFSVVRAALRSLFLKVSLEQCILKESSESSTNALLFHALVGRSKIVKPLP